MSKRKPLVLTPGSVLETTPQIYVERGGEATYHGPGQLVVYPIVKIFPASQQVARPYRGVANLIRAMEAALHELCQSYGVKTCSLPGETGVWTDTSETPHLQKKKLASIGIAVTKWVTYHGLALNFSVDPAVWRAFNPCGYSGEVMSDLETEAQQKIDAKKLIENFEKIINLHF